MEIQVKENFYGFLPVKNHLNINIRSFIKQFAPFQLIYECNFTLDMIVITEVVISENIVIILIHNYA